MAAQDGEPMTMRDLTELYRIEKKSKVLSAVRPDLYPAMAALLKSQNDEYRRLLSEDPESILLEGINQRRKSGRDDSKKIVDTRMEKICDMALRGAMGSDVSVNNLTKEEKEYYDAVLDASERLRRTLDRLNGRKTARNAKLIAEPEPAEEPPENKWVAVPRPAPAEPPDPEAAKGARAAEEPRGTVAELPPLPPEDADDGDEEYETQIPEDELDSMIPEEDPMPVREAPAPAKAPEPAPAPRSDAVLVRVLESMPTISGPERDYTLGAEDVVLMPAMLAEVMAGRGKGEKLNPSARVASLSCGCRRGTPGSPA